MKKILLILLCLLIVAGCQNNSGSEPDVNEKSKKTVDDVVFNLYRNENKNNGRQFFTNDNVRIYFLRNGNHILIDDEKEVAADLETRELLDYQEYSQKFPRGYVYNFAHISDKCREGYEHFTRVVPHFHRYGVLAYDSSLTTEYYISDSICKNDISDEVINEIDKTDGLKVWGREIPFNNIPEEEFSASQMIAIEIKDTSLTNTEKVLRELYEKYDLVTTANYAGDFRYNTLFVSEDVSFCADYNLNCEVVD